ncbi:CDK5 regulatory subunit-associated protein 3 isoform X2 [Oxyura jamaicensis]|uniref:CDK5 regulatory subunit-associated protein 3 isoform X2 n=1 Tax=Oxyura jamaicensis TaxID=8884 RepID=UPI0015A65C67|nr:CDK5 regulatory subunit-associated protein 3 isoform X2 [Oxyura jamaicensis]XP_035170460.1 CDK5 regulatory subunit-associated protein 3 isoform X2 [Oxyura jamaicensis]
MQASPQDYRDVPIDIQTSKLLDWLLDRRHCGRRWQAQARAVRQRMEAALRDMPEHPEIRQLLAGTALHYFHCLRIVEILRGTEASTRNLFGRYSSQRMKDWQEIVALYEKENTYLAELASLLVRSISYEAPALRKQISRCQQAQQDFARREEECQLAAAELRERFYASCKQYGIAGDNVRQELLALVKELPSLLSEIGAGAGALSEAIELYEACVEFVCESSAEPVLPLLRHVGRRGNTTVYEWRTGLEPVRVERPEVQEVPEQPKEDEIDWGDFTLEPSGATDGAAAGGGAQDEIDWGIALEPSPQDDGIDWGDGESDGAQILVLEAGTNVPEGVACGSDALTLLEHAETRNQFIDELMELELFLAQRLVEMEEEADFLAASQFQLAPAALQGQTSARVGSLLASTRALLGQLGTRRMQHLFTILASPRYVDRVSELLQQKLRQAELLLAKREALSQKRQEALAEQGALEPKLDRLLERTGELQRLIEADISKRYGGRPVNLMGISL